MAWLNPSLAICGDENSYRDVKIGLCESMVNSHIEEILNETIHKFNRF